MVHPRLVRVEIFPRVEELVLKHEMAAQEKEASEEMDQTAKINRIFEEAKFAAKLMQMEAMIIINNQQ